MYHGDVLLRTYSIQTELCTCVGTSWNLKSPCESCYCTSYLKGNKTRIWGSSVHKQAYQALEDHGNSSSVYRNPLKSQLRRLSCLLSIFVLFLTKTHAHTHTIYTQMRRPLALHYGGCFTNKPLSASLTMCSGNVKQNKTHKIKRCWCLN